MQISVFLTQLSAERLWGIDRPQPEHVELNVNINVLEPEKKSDTMIETPFIFAVAYNPSIAQINIKGRVRILGEAQEIAKMLNDYKEKKPPSPSVVQTIANITVAETIILARSIGVPPPIPPLPAPPSTPPQSKPNARYTS